MKSIEPNILLAITTAIALCLLISVAHIFGEPGHLLKYGLTALIVPGLYVPLNGWYRKRMGLAAVPMIHPGAPSTAIWAMIFPALIMLLAVIPLVWSGHDYGLAIVMAAVVFAATVQSAWLAFKASKT